MFFLSNSIKWKNEFMKTSLGLILSMFSVGTLYAFPALAQATASPIVNDQNNTVGNNNMRLDQDLQVWQAYLGQAKASGDRDQEATALTNIGSIYDSANQYDKALEYYQQGMLIFRSLGERKKEVWALNNIGTTYNHLKQYNKAVESYLKAITICRLEGTLVSEGWVLASLGHTYRSMKQSDRAIEAFQQAIKVFQSTNSQQELAETIRILREVQKERPE
jgi:tetratricopeptide (TPR) repeat protein